MTLFTIAKLWNWSKSPPTNEWIKKMTYKYTMEDYPAIKNKKIMLFMGKMGQSRDHHFRQNKSD
jgi:hypothetical protein